MIWLRRIFVGLLSVILLISLIGVAISMSTRVTLANPTKINGWINQSGLYSYLLNRVSSQAQKVTGNNGQSNQLNTAISQSVQSAFPESELRQDVSTFINSNYSWLEGRSATPNFKIDLTGVKKTIAVNMGTYAQTRIASLPVCTLNQTLQLQNVSPLSVPCRPVTIDPASVSAQFTDQIENNNVLLSNPVITASTLNPDNNNGKPYYQKLSKAPSIYQWSLRLPWLLGVLSIISALGILFCSPIKRKGMRRISFVMLFSGVVLIAINLVSDSLTPGIDRRITNKAAIGSLQTILVGFLNRLEASMVKVDLWFGISYVALAVLFFILLFELHRRGREIKPAKIPPMPETVQNQQAEQSSNVEIRLSPSRPQTYIDINSPSPKLAKTPIPATAPVLKKVSNKSKRLIQ